MQKVNDRLEKNTKAIWIFGAAALIIAVMAGASWAQLINNAQRDQPLRISACQPDMLGCIKWFPPNPPDEPWPWDQSVRVVGDRCNASAQEIAYDITIHWESIESNTRFTVIEARAVWVPGCERYDFTFEVPAIMRGVADESGSLGQWKLIGDAMPVNDKKWRPYQWDVTGAVEIVDPESVASG